MLHEDTLIATLAVSLGLAFVFGLLVVRLRMPPLVGYLLAGIALSPYTPGWVADAHLAPQLAEIGVMLLMFGVGMHFSLRDLLAVTAIAIPGADRADRRRDCPRRTGRAPVGLAARRRPAVRPRAVGGQHRGAAARARAARQPAFATTAASPSAGCWWRTW